MERLRSRQCLFNEALRPKGRGASECRTNERRHQSFTAISPQPSVPSLKFMCSQLAPSGLNSRAISVRVVHDVDRIWLRKTAQSLPQQFDRFPAAGHTSVQTSSTAGVMNSFTAAVRRVVQQGYDLLVAFDNLVGPLVLLVTTTVVGTVGYKLLLDVNWLDALYQSVITLSTVGFHEVVPFSDGAKVFTIVLVFFGVGAVFYVITLLAATVVEGEARRKIVRRLMMRKVEALQDHFVVCGFGKVGREIALVLAGREQPFVILDIDTGALADAEALGYLVVHGDAESEEVQRRAGVDRAQSVVAATESDSLNTYITLVARSLNPNAYIVARSESHTSEQKLMLAGAQRVISPYAIGARRMALSALQPMMADFMDVLAAGRLGDQLIAEIDISQESVYRGQALSEVFRNSSNTTVLAIRRADQSLIVGPRGNAILESGDIVIVLANENDLSRLLRPGSATDSANVPEKESA